MDIEEFVAETLIAVVRGIQKAQDAEGTGGLVAPKGIGGHAFPSDSGVVNQARIVSTVVKFDIAVTAATTAGGEGGGKVKIAVVEANIGGGLQNRNESTSRIQFSVPLVMPSNKREWHKEPY